MYNLFFKLKNEDEKGRHFLFLLYEHEALTSHSRLKMKFYQVWRRWCKQSGRYGGQKNGHFYPTLLPLAFRR